MNLKNTIGLRPIRLFIIKYTEILLQNQTSHYAYLRYRFLLALNPTAYYLLNLNSSYLQSFLPFALSKALLTALGTILSLHSMATVFSSILLLNIFLQHTSQKE